MNTNVLIPKGLKVKVRTWNDLVFLGKENLIAIRAYWRSREDKLGSHVKWLQTAADFMIGGPSNLESMTIVKERKKNVRRDKDGRFIGGKGSTDFACCGNCRYANIVNMEIFESFDDVSTVEVSHCSLMARIFHRAKYNWFYLDNPCPFFYECKDGNTRIVNSLKKEKNKTLKAKKTVRGYIDMLSEAIDVVPEKGDLTIDGPYMEDDKIYIIANYKNPFGEFAPDSIDCTGTKDNSYLGEGVKFTFAKSTKEATIKALAKEGGTALIERKLAFNANS